MGKRISSRGLKKNQSYTFEEAALILCLHVQTVRRWVKAGLPIMRGQKPYLVHGEDLKAFLTTRQEKVRTRLKPNEVFCLRCRRAVRPDGDLADYTPSSAGGGRLAGICPHCEGMAHRFVSAPSLRTVAPELLVTPQGGEESLAGSINSPSNAHFHDED